MGSTTIDATAGEGRTVEFAAQGMTCGSCAARIQRTLAKHAGVTDAEVNYATGRALVTLDPQRVEVTQLQQAVDRLGYQLAPLVEAGRSAGAEEDAEQAEARAMRSWLVRVVIATPPTLVVLWLAMFSGELGEEPWARWTQFALATPVQFYVGWPFLAEMVRRARRFTANMDTLIGIGTLAAYGYSAVALFTDGFLYFEVAAAIVALLALGRYFEARAKSEPGRSRAAGAARARCQAGPGGARRPGAAGRHRPGPGR